MSNNEYVKVDDLFKGKPDKEERIPAGAWNNMQRLLETAGPIGGGMSSGNFSRYVALALLTLGMGATAVTWQHNEMQRAAAPAFSSNEDHASSLEPSANASGNAGSKGNTNVAANNTALNGNTNQHKDASDRNKPTSGNNGGAQNSTTHFASGTNNTPNTGNYNNGNHSNTANPLIARESRKERRTNRAIAANLATQPQAAQNGSDRAATASATNSNTQNPDMALASIDRTMYLPKASVDSHYAAVVTDNRNNNKYVLSNKDEQWYKETAKTVNEIHTTKNVVRNKEHKVTDVLVDTTKNIRFTRVQLEPLTSNEKMQLLAITSRSIGFKAKAYPTESSNSGSETYTRNSAESNVSLAPLSSYKVASTTTAQKGSFARHFYDVMSNYFNMQKPYYFGAAVGLNTTLGSPMQTGYHFNLGAYYELKERLSLGAELKYAHSTVLQKTISDAFNAYENQTSQVVNGQTVYSATQLSKTNNYQLKGISSFELPITLRYQLSKLSILGGLNASYLFPVNYTVQMNQDREAPQSVTSLSPFKATSSAINTNDFRSRLGLGYTVGFIYDLSKNVSLDLRMSQTLWNNVKGTSSLSTNLYQQPNIQFSLFYFLGKKDKVIYMMNDRK